MNDACGTACRIRMLSSGYKRKGHTYILLQVFYLFTIKKLISEDNSNQNFQIAICRSTHIIILIFLVNKYKLLYVLGILAWWAKPVGGNIVFGEKNNVTYKHSLYSKLNYKSSKFKSNERQLRAIFQSF